MHLLSFSRSYRLGVLSSRITLSRQTSTATSKTRNQLSTLHHSLSQQSQLRVSLISSAAMANLCKLPHPGQRKKATLPQTQHHHHPATMPVRQCMISLAAMGYPYRHQHQEPHKGLMMPETSPQQQLAARLALHLCTHQLLHSHNSCQV